METRYAPSGIEMRMPEQTGQVTEIQMRWVRAGQPSILAEQPLPGHSNYLLGSDPSRWIKTIPQSAQIRYQQLYPGIDLVFHGTGSSIEHDFQVEPGADPSRIAFRLNQAAALLQDESLEVKAGTHAVHFAKPVAYQQYGTRRKQIPVAFLISTEGIVTFKLGAYDASRPLVIDPVLSFSTYLDGSMHDEITDVATDPAGNIYVTGYTNSTDFPTAHAFQPQLTSCGGSPCENVFITKLDPTGKTLLYSTYLGGAGQDFAGAIAVDAQGNAVVVGTSGSIDFPQAGNLPSRAYTGSSYFIASLKPDGSGLNYSGPVGGTPGNYAPNQGRVALDVGGNAYLAGVTDDLTFPITPGTLSPSFSGYPNEIAFALKVDPTGKLLYATVIPGNAPPDVGDVFTNLLLPQALAVDSSGQLIVAGSAGVGLPTTPGVIGASYANFTGGTSGFLLQLNAAASATNYASYVPGTDDAKGMAVDSGGNIYLAGGTSQQDLPTTATAYQKSAVKDSEGGFASGYIVKLSPLVSSVLAATYLDGTNASLNNGTSFQSLALDSHSNVFVGGYTGSTDFPLQNPLSSQWASSSVDVGLVLASLTPDLSALTFGSFLNPVDLPFPYPGSLFDALTVDANDNLIVVGTTYVSDFPTTAGSFEPAPPPAANPNAIIDHTFVAKINMATPAPSVCPATWSVDFGQVNALTASNVTVNITNCGNAPLTLSSLTSTVATVTGTQNCVAIAPGAVCPVTLTFRPIDDTFSNGTILIADNADISPQILSVGGHGVASNLVPDANPLAMGHYLVGTQSPARMFYLSNRGNGPLTITSVNLAGSEFSLAPNTCTSTPNNGCALTLVFSPTTPGPANGSIVVASNDPVHPQLTIALTGTGDPAYAAPTISLVGAQIPESQQTLPINNGSASLQIAGTNFYPASGVQFNGVPQPTTFVTNQLLSVSIAASSLTALGEYPLTVVNPAPGGGASASVTMTTYQYLPQIVGGMVSVPATGLIYATSAAAATSNPNTVLPIDPTTGRVQTPIPVGNDPGLLAASSDGAYLFVANNGDKTLQRINLATNAVEATFPLAPSVFCAGCLLEVTDLETVPGSPQQVVLAQGAMVSLYDANGLVNSAPNAFIEYYAPTFNSITFAGSPLALYAEPFPNVQNPFFNTVALTSSGLVYTPISGTGAAPPTPSSQVISDGTLLYTSSGTVWNPATQAQVGSFPVANVYNDILDLAIDPSLEQIYAAGPGQFSNTGSVFDALAITSYGLKSLSMQNTLAFPAINGDEALSLVRWGKNGFAFFVPEVYSGAAGIYLTRSDVLTNQQLLNPGPFLSSFTPTAANAGSPATALTVNGKNFLPASIVNWNGAPLTTTYVSGTQLTALIPASDLTTAGTADITVTTPAPGGGTSSLQGFTINAVFPTASLSGSNISFGSVVQGVSSAAQPVTVTNSGNAALNIGTIAATGDFAETNACAATLAPNASCQISVVFSPTAAGARSGALSLVDNAPDSPQIINLSGTGVAAVALGPVTGGSTTATVTSGGTAAYSLSLAGAPGFAGAVTISCAGAPANATCTVTPASLMLAAGKSAQLQVAVTTEGAQSAQLGSRYGPRAAGFGLASLLLLPLLKRARRGIRAAGIGAALLLVSFASNGCGGGSVGTSASPTTPPGTYTLNVTATAGASKVTQNLTLVVN